MYKLLLTILTVTSSQLFFSQNYNWGIGYGSTETDEGYEFTIDSQNNIITTGYFMGEIDLDPSSAVSNFQNNGQEDVFIQKMNADGSYAWAKSFGGNGHDIGHHIVADSEDNILVLGQFEGTVDFNAEGTGGNLTSLGERDIFLLKLNSAGDFQWVKQIGGIGNDQGFDMVINDDQLFIFGRYSDTVDFGAGNEDGILTSSGLSDNFILKTDGEGQLIWIYSYGGIGEDYGGNIMVDILGNVFLSGAFNQAIDFDNGEGSSYLNSMGGFFGFDHYLLKLNSIGEFGWVKHQLASIGDVFVAETKMDALGNIYTIGETADMVDFDPSDDEFTTNTSLNTLHNFIQKLNSHGELLWAKTNSALPSKTFDFDNDNNLVLVGEFTETNDFDLNEDVFNLSPNVGLYATYIQTLTTDGGFVDAFILDAAANQDCRMMIKDVNITDDGSIHILSSYTGAIDLDPSSNQEVPVVSNGNKDVFFVKLSPIDLGIDDKETVDWSVYPIPANRFLEIRSNLDIDEVVICDFLGQAVLRTKTIKKIDICNLSPGNYTITIQSNNYFYSKAFIKL